MVFGLIAVIVLILMLIGIHGCSVSSRNSALRDYNNSVAAIVQQSVAESHSLFTDLKSIGGASNAQEAQKEIAGIHLGAEQLLQKAKGLSVPSQMTTAQGDFTKALQMRSDGLETVASNIEQALGTTSYKPALQQIAVAMATFYASDVLYTLYAAKEIAIALNSSGVGTGQGVQPGQFLPSLSWLATGSISKLIVGVQQAPQSLGPGPHGDKINSVAVAGKTLSTVSENAVTASPAPTFSLNFTNSGASVETETGCEVTVEGTSVKGHGTVGRTQPGSTYTCTATLDRAPPTGQYRVRATIEKVPGETDMSNNSQVLPITFE